MSILHTPWTGSGGKLLDNRGHLLATVFWEAFHFGNKVVLPFREVLAYATAAPELASALRRVHKAFDRYLDPEIPELLTSKQRLALTVAESALKRLDRLMEGK